MCGIVGLHLKDPKLYPRLGELLAQMLDGMASRGPDSAGVALYDDAERDRLRFSVRSAERVDWEGLAERLSAELGTEVTAERRAQAAMLAAAENEDRFLACLRRLAPDVVLVGWGRSMEVYKDVGAPIDICARYAVPKRSGYQGIGHTRMATESAVTTDHSHPFAPMQDLSLVHNGTLSNPSMIRRRLEREGIGFDTDNDSEVAARYVAHHLHHGADLHDAFRMVLKELDGFFTLLVGTDTQFAIVRDSFACKPAVVAETDGYVAVASEYHALAGLPGIAGARVFEPMPEEVHVWTR